jgi:hypothetical protein
MTLRPAEPSPEVVETVRSHLSALAARPEFQGRGMALSEPSELDLAVPHDVYSVGLDQLSAGASLQDAEAVGQRFLVVDGDTPVASAEVTPEGGDFQANEGPFVAATLAAIERAEEDPELSDGRYELRLLRIPALYLMALWLKDEDGEGDRVIPLDPAPEPLEAGRHYRPAELMDELARMAAARREFDDVG